MPSKAKANCRARGWKPRWMCSSPSRSFRGKSLGQTRLENADYVMIMGNGVTVDAAMKSATTEMSRWLADAYGLTPQDIAAFLGTAMEYDIAEVVDSEYDVVAKVSKDALARLGK